ncbi:MAG: carboxypeptidase regulatory-like domain-containing protein [Anaerolineae bacterium]|nr:carboxypeptidase regulatory-like domain-containing protein [Anaerolineae bacterium]
MKRVLIFALLLLVMGAVVVPAAAQNLDQEGLTILMASPGEGESFYAAPKGFLLSVPISGQVVSYGEHLDPATVEVTLEFIDMAGDREQLTTTLDSSGFFEVWASIQSFDRPFVSDDPHEIEDCAICHRFEADLVMPEQVMLVSVEARAEDGRTGRAVRNLRLERGNYRDLAVRVEGLPEGADAAQVSASTVIFEWRRRAFYAPISTGEAVVQLEGLAHADLVYEVALEPLVVDGLHYSAAPQAVVVPGGDAAPPAVTLRAHPSMASLSGQVRDGVSGDGIPADVLVVDRLLGRSFAATAAEDGHFAFPELPVAEYTLLARAPGGFHLPRRFDLTDEIDMSTRINLTPAGEGVLSGTVTLEGQPLPFAEVRVPDLPAAYADPLSGAFVLEGAPAGEELAVTVTAPGCYGVQLSGAAQDLGEIALSVHDDTQVITRGGARLYLPAQTAYSDENNVVRLENGVLWVRNVAGAASPPLVIEAGGYRLQGEEASFAVEAPGGAHARLYVSEGRVLAAQVLAAQTDENDPIYVMMGQTLVLDSGGAIPVDLIPGAGALLRSEAGITVPFEEAPTQLERASAAAYQLLVIGAKGIMALAYAISYALPILFGVGLIILLLRGRKTAANNP